jgi:hypothetical protein
VAVRLEARDTQDDSLDARERQAFHARADRAIWNAWSNRAMLAVEGTSEFAKRDIAVFMDIRWVMQSPIGR